MEQLKDDFEWDKIDNVEILGYQIEFSEDDKLALVSALSKADFYKSNWRKEGPTGTVITFYYKNGNYRNFQWWGGDIFETYDNKSQFLIKSEEMKNIINKYGITEPGMLLN